MRKVMSQLAVGALLAVSTASLTVQAQAQTPPAQPELKLSKQEREALLPVQTAVNAKDYAAAVTALTAAQASIQSPDGRYAIGNFQFSIGATTKNVQLATAGLEGMLASGKVPKENQARMYKALANYATDARDYDKADRALTRYIEMVPNDVDALIIQAQTRFGRNRTADGIAILDRAIGMRRSAGQAVPESWYRVAVAEAFKAKLAPQTYKYTREWVGAYPNAKNWRDALLVLRDLSAPDAQTEVDIYRLMRANKALAGERDYGDFARKLSMGGYPGEAKAVLDEGVAARMIDPAKAPFNQMRATLAPRVAADRLSLPGEEKKALAVPAGKPALAIGNAYLGYGEYAKAAALYRAALQKGGVDTNLVNTRLGLSLALAGQRTEAEAAFKAITGPRSDLAAFMLTWLSSRG